MTRFSTMALAHKCHPPTIASGTAPIQPDWTCAQCNRVWRDCRTSSGLQWWAEIRGAA